MNDFERKMCSWVMCETIYVFLSFYVQKQIQRVFLKVFISTQAH